ncbi:hypothetical protein [Paraburkholderia ultramafica]|uniref:hypothetical protein n=1 Tax=Paraburkholderia ultramafica TaxID=1544867 RepID=UPI001583FAA4|nr:hypothetical protein [Paraburkholderia ultramafica]
MNEIGASPDGRTETEAFFMPNYIRRPQHQLDNTLLADIAHATVDAANQDIRNHDLPG